jgi:hypothetical protein
MSTDSADVETPARARPGRRGTIGVEIFEEVEKIVAADGITRSAAFQRISERTGRQQGTVAANYYRIARERGADLQPRGRRASTRGGRRRRAGGVGGGDAEAALQRAVAAVEDLAVIVRRQGQEIAALREKGEQLDRLKRLVAKNT